MCHLREMLGGSVGHSSHRAEATLSTKMGPSHVSKNILRLTGGKPPMASWPFMYVFGLFKPVILWTTSLNLHVSANGIPRR